MIEGIINESVGSPIPERHAHISGTTRSTAASTNLAPLDKSRIRPVAAVDGATGCRPTSEHPHHEATRQTRIGPRLHRAGPSHRLDLYIAPQFYFGPRSSRSPRGLLGEGIERFRPGQSAARCRGRVKAGPDDAKWSRKAQRGDEKGRDGQSRARRLLAKALAATIPSRSGAPVPIRPRRTRALSRS